MIKKLLTGVLCLSLTSPLMAGAINTPKDNLGFTVPTVDWAGVESCKFDSSTGTAQAVCFVGAGVVYGVLIASDIVAGQWMNLRDTGSATNNGSTMTVVFASGTSNTAGNTGSNALVQVSFFKPLKFTTGLTANTNIAPQAGALYTILYRKKTSGTGD